jgi:uncharacterized damage-inducible protein DinB
MDASILGDAFAHHSWATLRLIDACLELEPEQLETVVPGTYGSILDTMRHIVGGDAWYLFVMTEERVPNIDESTMDLGDLRKATEGHAGEWPRLLAERSDPETVVVRTHEDGSQTSATIGIRLAQVLHHGSDHRSQVCTALTSLGVEPPTIDVWDYGETIGRVNEMPAP